MVTRNLYAIFTLLSFFVFVGCNSDDDQNNQKSVVGNWSQVDFIEEITPVEKKSNSKFFNDLNSSISRAHFYSFNSDGTFEILDTNNCEVYFGFWTQDDKQITFSRTTEDVFFNRIHSIMKLKKISCISITQVRI